MLTMCRKGLHPLAGENVLHHKAGNRQRCARKCRICYNERLKIYMRTYRKKEGKHDLDYHVDHPS